MLEAVRRMLLMLAAPAVAALAGTLMPLLLRDRAIKGQARSAEGPDGAACAEGMVHGGWDDSVASSAEPLLGLLWPEEDAEAMLGAGSAKRLGVRGSCPAANSELSSWASCFAGAELVRLTSISPSYSRTRFPARRIKLQYRLSAAHVARHSSYK